MVAEQSRTVAPSTKYAWARLAVKYLGWLCSATSWNTTIAGPRVDHESMTKVNSSAASTGSGMEGNASAAARIDEGAGAVVTESGVHPA